MIHAHNTGLDIERGKKSWTIFAYSEYFLLCLWYFAFLFYSEKVRRWLFSFTSFVSGYCVKNLMKIYPSHAKARQGDNRELWEHTQNRDRIEWKQTLFFGYFVFVFLFFFFVVRFFVRKKKISEKSSSLFCLFKGVSQWEKKRECLCWMQQST